MLLLPLTATRGDTDLALGCLALHGGLGRGAAPGLRLPGCWAKRSNGAAPTAVRPNGRPKTAARRKCRCRGWPRPRRPLPPLSRARPVASRSCGWFIRGTDVTLDGQTPFRGETGTAHPTRGMTCRMGSPRLFLGKAGVSLHFQENANLPIFLARVRARFGGCRRGRAVSSSATRKASSSDCDAFRRGSQAVW